MANLNIAAALVDIEADAGVMFTLIFFPVYDATGLPFDLTGYGAEFIAQEKATDEAPLFNFSTANADAEIEVTELLDPEANALAPAVKIVIDDADMVNVPPVLQYRVNLIDSNGNKQPALKGKITFDWVVPA